MDVVFSNRCQAGKLLAERLWHYNRSCIVLALPRGGVVVGYEVAKKLHARLSIVVVRKLGVPWQKELGFGAIAEGKRWYINNEAVKYFGLSKKTVDDMISEETSELVRRIKVYRQGKQLLNLTGKTVILVDDGVATGVTIVAAIDAVKKHHPKQLVVAVPVCATETAEVIRGQVDNVVCLYEVKDMQSIGMYYSEFQQVTDEEVVSLLQRNHYDWKKSKNATSLRLPLRLVAL